MNHAPKTANATYAATLCDQLWVDGLRVAFVAPGSRSTPLALALVEHPGIDVHVFHDERAAAFAALGTGMATGAPALVLCSSGTAGAHFYAAVIEADASMVPMIVVTADRPPELWGRGAPQTIDQTHLYGTHVRDFVEPGPPDDQDAASWRPLARRLWTACTGAEPGPVHANLSFRDPLTGTPGTLPDGIEPIASPSPTEVDNDLLVELCERLDSTSGVILVGRHQSDPATILELAKNLGWPVFADHRSGCRTPGSAHVIRSFDSVLRSSAFTDRHRPEVVLRIGEILASKAVSQWVGAVAQAGATVVASRPHGRNIDPESVAALQFDEPGVVTELERRTRGCNTDAEWLQRWVDADRSAGAAIATELALAPTPNEIEIAQACVEAVPSGGALVVSSSMPVRDVEWFGQNRNDIAVYANRGANGIDGIIATAVGVALTGAPTVCLIGDVAFLHDSSSLVALRERAVDLTIVVTNNDGGGIFSFLPQHELLRPTEYETLFGTPHGTDLAALAQAHGLAVSEYGGTVDSPAGVRVIVAFTDRASNLALHDRVHRAAVEALDC